MSTSLSIQLGPAAFAPGEAVEPTLIIRNGGEKTTYVPDLRNSEAYFPRLRSVAPDGSEQEFGLGNGPPSARKEVELEAGREVGRTFRVPADQPGEYRLQAFFEVGEQRIQSVEVC